MTPIEWVLAIVFGIPALFFALWLVSLVVMFPIGLWKTRPGLKNDA